MQLLTRPLKSEIDLHESSTGGFTGRDLVFLFVGPNDAVTQWGATGLAARSAGATAETTAAAVVLPMPP